MRGQSTVTSVDGLKREDDDELDGGIKLFVLHKDESEGPFYFGEFLGSHHNRRILGWMHV